MLRAAAGAERHPGVEPVDGGRGRKGEVLHLVVSAPLEDVQEPGEVALHVGVGVRQGMPNPRLCRQVNHPVELVIREERFHANAVADVELEELKPSSCVQARQSRVLQGGVIVRIQVVHTDDRIAPFQEALCHVVANEPGCAGDKAIHLHP